MTRQQKLDAFARSKGYPSYFAYRDARAKAEGYSSYGEKRRARQAQRRTVPAQPIRPYTAQRPLAAQNPADDLTRDVRMRIRETNRLATDNSLEAARITIRRQRTPATKDRLVRPVVGALDELDGEIQQFFRGEFRQAYAAGARAANPNWKPSSEDIEDVKRMAGSAEQLLLRNNEFAKRNARRTIPALVDMERPKALRIARKNPIKGGRKSNGDEQSFQTYGEMSLRAITARAYNTAYLRTAAAGGAQLFSVYDGADCGWRHHRDTELAAGKIVTLEEAMSFPIAHPNCVRGFVAAPEAQTPSEGPLKRAARAAGRIAKESARATVAGNAVSLARHLVTDERVQQAAMRVISAGRADFLQYKQNLATVARLYDHSRRARIAAMGNVTDIATRTAPSVDARDVADDVMAWMDDFAEGEEVPEHVLHILGVDSLTARKVVGDRMQTFSTMYNSTYRGAAAPIKRTFPTKTIGGREQPPRVRREPATTRDVFEGIAANAFYDWLGPRIPQFKYLKMTFPNINGSIGFADRPRRVSGAIGDMVKVTATSIKDRGVINHLSLNPNGLLRLGLTKDPETGWVTPTFRLIPPGPLHIMTKVNRGVQGNITSLSGEVRLVTGQPLMEGVSARFNLNLRKLNIENLSDIKRLKMEDFRKFDREDIRGVSLASDLRLRGYNLFDISRTFRLPWEEAEKLWALTNFELGEIVDQIRAQNARKKFVVIEGGLTGPRVPPMPGQPSRPLLRVVDPETGDPFGPGSRPSFAQRVDVPGKLKSVPARRAYIEARLTNAERERVAALRLAGDYSTIRHLRNRDKLTWEQIAVEMGMSINRVKKIYKEGTTE